MTEIPTEPVVIIEGENAEKLWGAMNHKRWSLDYRFKDGKLFVYFTR